MAPVVPLLLLCAAFMLKEVALPSRLLSRLLATLLAVGVVADLVMVGVQSLYNSRYDAAFAALAKYPDLESVYSLQCYIAPFPLSFHRSGGPRVEWHIGQCGPDFITGRPEMKDEDNLEDFESFVAA